MKRNKKLEELIKIGEDSMTNIKLNIRNEYDISHIHIIPFGDLHIGTSECNYEKIESQIEYIKSKKDIRVIGMGDMMNTAIKDAVGHYDEDLKPQNQYDYLKALLEPVRNKIYGLHIGNHEQRIWNTTGMNPIKTLCNDLKLNYLGFSCFHKIKVGDYNYVIYSTHGSSGATAPQTKINKCISLAMSFNADLYLYGHVHDLDTKCLEVSNVSLKNKVVNTKKKYFVLTGHYLNYADSYAEMKNLIMGKQGSPKIELRGDRWDIHVST